MAADQLIRRSTHCGIWTHAGCIPGGGGGRLRKAGLPTEDHGMKRRVDPTTVESTGITSGFAGSGCCSAGMLSSAAVRSGIAAPVVSSRATSRLYSRVTTTRHESVHDRATAQRTAVQLKSGGRRLLRKVISSKIGAGAQRIDESGAPSARIPGRGFEVAPTLGPPIKGTAAEDAQSCTSARTIHHTPVTTDNIIVS